jgi:hypothetical protein
LLQQIFYCISQSKMAAGGIRPIAGANCIDSGSAPTLRSGVRICSGMASCSDPGTGSVAARSSASVTGLAVAADPLPRGPDRGIDQAGTRRGCVIIGHEADIARVGCEAPPTPWRHSGWHHSCRTGAGSFACNSPSASRRSLR